MLQLIYISTASPGFDPKEIDGILRISRRNNTGDRITGLLVYDGKRFLQALEGEDSLVERCYARIRLDTRHRAVVKLSERKVETREFGEWAMAGQRVPTAGRAAAGSAEAVAELIAHMPRSNTRALFQSFTQIKRAA